MSRTLSKKVFYKLCFISSFLVLCFLMFLLYKGYMGVLRIDTLPAAKVNVIKMPQTATEPPMPKNTCSYQLLSPVETLEFESLRELIYWPETPQLPADFSLKNSSNPALSSFTVVPKKEGRSWHVGEELEVLVQIRDFFGRPKKSGGDVLFARLHSPALKAGVAGKVFDHENGSYTAVFSLLWEGTAYIEITLVHPSEAVTVLKKLTQEQPDRVYFKSLFRSGSVSESTTCNVCLQAAKEDLCNYSDVRTGEPWFCYKPKRLNCDVRITHSTGGYKQKVTRMEASLFQRNVNLKLKIPATELNSITILTKQQGKNLSLSHSKPSGYYHQGAWHVLNGTPVHQFNNPAAMNQCLKGKVIHLLGDSTIRQWFEFLISKLPGLKSFNLKRSKKSGPLMALDFKNNILVTFRLHGPPLRFSNVPVNDIHYVENEVDGLVGGSDTVVILSVWAHFGSFPVEVYMRRVWSVRRAVVRLLARAPDTLVIIRTANPKQLTLNESLINSDWYSLQHDKVLKAIFRGVNVSFLDAWQMTLAHFLPHNLHPPPPIIKNMVDVLLSYMCPKK